MRLYLRALSYFRSDWRLVIVWLLLIACATGIGLLTAWPMAILLDTVLASPGQPANQDWIHRLLLGPLPTARVGQIVGLAAVGLLLKVAQDLLGVAQTLVSNQINYNGLMRIRCDLYRKLQALNLAYHRSQPQGDAIYRLSSDTFGLQTILQVLVSAVVAVMTLAVMTFVLGARNWTLTLIAFSIAPFLAIVNVMFGRRLKERSLECKRRDASFTTVVQRSMSAIGLVQAFGREADEFGRFHGTARETIRAWWSLNRQQMAYNLIVGTLFGVGGAVIFGYGGYLVYRSQFLTPGVPGGMTVGDLVVFTAYLGMLWNPLCTLTGLAANAQGGIAGAQRVFEVLDRDPVIADRTGATAFPRRPRVLEFDRVSFAYSSSPILNDVSLRIEPGEMVAFVGVSGSGKSTLLNLLPRFYEPTSGVIRLDGTDVRDVRVADLRKHVALVLQESVILPTTVAENIAYGAPHATRAQIHDAARLAGAAEFIERLSAGYDTEVAENGASLSGGQRQRISVARALLTGAPFILLDEPTSALDPHHERVITESLRAMKGQRTIVLVSHRLNTVVDCDRIYVMSAGRIVEQGTHEQLLARRGSYYEMAVHQMQLGNNDPPRGPRLASAA
jgi:subfamily B ATP-binding cassette protein MsbA